MRSVQEMTGQMLTGRLEPNPILRGPMHSSCMYCDFAQACHRDSCKHANRYIAAVKAALEASFADGDSPEKPKN